MGTQLLLKMRKNQDSFWNLYSMQIEYSARFIKKFQKLSKVDYSLKQSVISTIEIFQNNPNYPSLRLHKLSNTNSWSISVNMRIRILFVYVTSEKVLMLDLGGHEIY